MSAVSRIGSSASSTIELPHEVREWNFGGRDEPEAPGQLLVACSRSAVRQRQFGPDALLLKPYRVSLPIDGLEVLDKIARGHELIEGELRQLRGAVHDLILHEQRRRDFDIAVLVGVQVEHELTERTLHAREALLQHDETRTRQFGRCLEVHLAQRLAELEMLLRREGVVALGPELMVLDIAVLVSPVGHFFERQVGDDFQSLSYRTS